MSRRSLIFDFDGTLADSLPAAVAVFNQLAPRFRLRAVDLDTARHTPTRELLKQTGVRCWRLPGLTRAFQAAVAEHMPTLRLWPGMAEVLQGLHADGRVLGILSSNSEGNVRTCLRANGVEGCFRFVVGSPRLFGKGSALRRILKSERLAAADVVYVGDELRDMTAAKKAGVAAVAVTWGFQAEALLRTAGPEYVIETPAGLREL